MCLVYWFKRNKADGRNLGCRPSVSKLTFEKNIKRPLPVQIGNTWLKIENISFVKRNIFLFTKMVNLLFIDVIIISNNAYICHILNLVIADTLNIAQVLTEARKGATERLFIDVVLETCIDDKSKNGDILVYLMGGFHNSAVSECWNSITYNSFKRQSI